ncbi:SIS domain-containing protein [Xylophilus rhododendri]|uniref:SIS domain-containing protein n=1 Tax=Xylophilus rhododendri TaxID=2697032 RepID=A0A857J398_9BURK|nr:SIS domain-containing protein [Xylophilus rhododendri]QHI98394.1 SIS domain-containing protein [Xylophilus rhododendri]
MLEHRIQQQFIDSADLNYQASEALSVPIALAVQAVVACITGGGKTLACGNGASAALAQTLGAHFVGGFERERPELAAITLTLDGALLCPAGLEPDTAAVFARQVRALGHAGDVLVALSAGGNCANVMSAIAAAHEREMTVVALTGRHGGRIAGMLRETDVHVAVPHDRLARVHEVHLLTLHCICDGVDAQLLGEREP